MEENIKNTEQEVKAPEHKGGDIQPTTFSSFERVLKMLQTYGPFKLILGMIMFVLFSYMAYIALNPGMIFERYDRYISEVHSKSVDYRMESSPLIRSYLNELASKTDAERAYILEFHNGKSNPSGLQWQFGDLTFINDGTDDISDEIQNVSLSRYNFANLVHDKGGWCGPVDELKNIDERFYNRMRLNHGVFFAFQMIYGSNMKEIGILGVSYLEVPENLNKFSLMVEMQRYASSISPLLDEASVNKKK